MNSIDIGIIRKEIWLQFQISQNFLIWSSRFRENCILRYSRVKNSHNYALNHETSHITYQNEVFFTTNTMVQKSERFAHAIRKYGLHLLVNTELWLRNCRPEKQYFRDDEIKRIRHYHYLLCEQKLRTFKLDLIDSTY